MADRLANATSPYLRQHADNPVDWWQWGPEAFEEARRRDVPVLLSVGYAACHWCHVMAHESFADPEVAELMNRLFVNIKVDREERPDVDAVYMEATQAMTGHGGWPMTCFLTPEGEPFHCGTYYPPTPRPGLPSFPQLLRAVGEAWAEDSARVRTAAADIVAKLAEYGGPLPEAPVNEEVLARARTAVIADVDTRHGGFGGAPKFPPSMVLEFLLRHAERTGDEGALAVALSTAEAMARGGIYDQLAGGFARYSVDARWEVPHFEKMLYDNALLLRAYAHLHRLTDSPLARRVTEETASFLLRELRTPEGGFASSLDADTDGVEGLTYVWTPEQLRAELGEDAEYAASVLAVTEEGNVEGGASTLRLPRDPEDRDRFERVRARLWAARNGRPQPDRDDKVITGWNGMAIAALAEAGAALDEPSWVAAAEEAAGLLLDLHLADGRLLRGSRDGVAGAALGVLEDHGCLADGLLALHQATGTRRWLTEALGLLDAALALFQDEEAPGRFHDTGDDAEALVRRPSDPGDNATPSGASSLTGALLTASALAGPEAAGRYREVVDQALTRHGMLAERAPRFAGHWLSVAEAVAAGPVQIGLVLAPDDPRGRELLAVARRHAPGGAPVVAAMAGHDGTSPLLAGRGLVGGQSAAYVCRGYVCDRPVTGASELRDLLLSAREH
ncbi:N-acylglucosamine 2-epimerase [Actinoalloteichus sp. AHMU CJ021]|uniref:thioredoxin domain-containing protein n=1 Tax=Actinoalloteichus sp. AHMU CJ021 TaxID=2072503 RepID=UPI000CA022DC|nr:N-acylglucosamine 2-epimerase [Actinoalloteichus sp. AHMU CJ021]